MTLWARIALWLALAATAAALVFGVVKGYEHWRDSVRTEGYEAGARDKKAEWDEADRKRNEETLAAIAAVNLESKRIQAKQESNRAQGERERRAALADARAARAESLRLSEWADAQVEAAAAASRGAADSGPGQQCAAAGAAARVLADVLKRADERAGVLAEAADAARIAGQQCAADYDALTLKATPP